MSARPVRSRRPHRSLIKPWVALSGAVIADLASILVELRTKSWAMSLVNDLNPGRGNVFIENQAKISSTPKESRVNYER